MLVKTYMTITSVTLYIARLTSLYTCSATKLEITSLRFSWLKKAFIIMSIMYAIISVIATSIRGFNGILTPAISKVVFINKLLALA